MVEAGRRRAVPVPPCPALAARGASSSSFALLVLACWVTGLELEPRHQTGPHAASSPSPRVHTCHLRCWCGNYFFLKKLTLLADTSFIEGLFSSSKIKFFSSKFYGTCLKH